MDTDSAPRLSALVLTLDEEDRLRDCLLGLHGWVDEIIVVDSGSEDSTLSIARRYADQVLINPWPGEGAQRQFALNAARGEWVLWIDADERVTPALAEEIVSTLRSPLSDEVTGYSIASRTRFSGRYCRFGGLGDRHVRLFRRSCASFDPGCLVHPQVELLPRTVAQLHHPMLHHSFRDTRHLLSKHLDYAERGARQMAYRPAFARVLAAALAAFLRSYLIKGGVLEGRRGLLHALFNAQYTFNKYAIAWTDADRETAQRPSELGSGMR